MPSHRDKILYKNNKNMSTNPIVKFENVTKSFSKLTKKTFKEFLPALFMGEKTTDFFTALSKISFDIQKGECVGIIGPNGSGKSTILKLVAGVMSPSNGNISVHGRVSPLIELGAGMHPELTGRENIYLNGAILGLKRKQIDANFQSIIDFSELSEFIDQPIKHYSSGMYMRLAFSIAVHVNPEILIVDEILAVGDPKFQQKCLDKMAEFKKQGVTILFVSHNLDTVKDFCTRVLYINHSVLKKDASSLVAIQEYRRDIASSQ
jgi:ABC-type polysaccharide/polyol phosphate transport system ATPase subunit